MLKKKLVTHHFSHDLEGTTESFSSLISSPYSCMTLIEAATEGNYERCQALLTEKLFIDETDMHDQTALMAAAMRGHYSICKLLIMNGAQVNAVDKVKRTPLLIAAVEGHPEICDLLLTYGAALEVVDEEGYSPLLRTIAKNHTLTCQVLLRFGAEVNLADAEGFTPLHWAVLQGHSKICKLLLQHGAQVDSIDKEGWTPLVTSLFNSHYKICEILLIYGATLNTAVVSRHASASIKKLKDNQEGAYEIRLSFGKHATKPHLINNIKMIQLIDYYKGFDHLINAITDYKNFIDFLRKSHQKGNYGVIRRALIFKLRSCRYPYPLFEESQQPEAFYQHLNYFAEWLKKNPGVVSKTHIRNEEILPIFADYLSQLASGRPFKILNFDIRGALETKGNLPFEISNLIFGHMPDGLAIAFHNDLVKYQGSLLKKSPETLSVSNNQVLEAPRYRPLIWSKQAPPGNHKETLPEPQANKKKSSCTS